MTALRGRNNTKKKKEKRRRKEEEGTGIWAVGRDNTGTKSKTRQGKTQQRARKTNVSLLLPILR